MLSSTGGKVTLGYVAEAPIWRSTYRIVLDADNAKLQGWALLHNDTDEVRQIARFSAQAEAAASALHVSNDTNVAAARAPCTSSWTS